MDDALDLKFGLHEGVMVKTLKLSYRSYQIQDKIKLYASNFLNHGPRAARIR